MKKNILMLVAVLLLSVVAVAQAPIKFNYQTVVRDASGNLVGNHLVHVKISILSQSFDGDVVYAEHSSAMTERSGMMTIVVGDGVVMEGDLGQIDWSRGPYFMRCDIDPKGGNNYSLSTAQQLVSVPYALYAGGGDYNKLSNLPDIKAMIRSIVKEEASNLYQESQGLSDVAAINNEMGFQQLKALGDPTDAQDAVTVAYMRRYVEEMISHVYDSSLMAASSMLHRGGVSESSSRYSRSSRSSNARRVQTENGLLSGVFSVSDGKQVRFSQGNLQYSYVGRHAVLGGGLKEGTWRFASSQYDENLDNNGQWESLLTWNSTGCEDDGAIGDACFDWGAYNAISNGGNLPGQWRLLSIDEWNYLRGQRQGARQKYAMATINGQAGVVFLPDNWTTPAGQTFLPGSARGFSTNAYTAEQWTAMESAGAVFLPAAGNLSGRTINNVGTYGSYWSSSVMKGGNVYSLDFYGTGLQTIGNQPSIGQSVRLVQDVQ